MMGDGMGWNGMGRDVVGMLFWIVPEVLACVMCSELDEMTADVSKKYNAGMSEHQEDMCFHDCTDVLEQHDTVCRVPERDRDGS